MIPRDQFEKMAVLALVAILLLAVLSIQAFATDMDDGLEKDTSYHDSGILPGYPGGSSPEDVPPSGETWIFCFISSSPSPQPFFSSIC